MTASCLTISLGSCSHYVRVSDCPSPPPSLLTPAAPLGQPGDLQGPVTMADILTLYARDIGEFEKLREKHKDLADYVVRYCLANQKVNGVSRPTEEQ